MGSATAAGRYTQTLKPRLRVLVPVTINSIGIARAILIVEVSVLVPIGPRDTGHIAAAVAEELRAGPVKSMPER